MEDMLRTNPMQLLRVNLEQKFPWFPNSKYLGISRDITHFAFSKRYVLMPPVSNSVATVVNPLKVDKKDYHKFQQDDPMWKTIRGMCRITFSKMHSYLGMCDLGVAALLDIPNSMWDKGPYNSQWSDLGGRAKNGYMPQEFMDSGGLINCQLGKEGEDAVLCTFMSHFPEAECYETGLEIMTSEHYKAAGVYDAFYIQEEGQPLVSYIEDMPVEIAGTPDTKIKMYCHIKKRVVKRVAEWKKPTSHLLMSDSAAWFPGASFYKRKNLCPYKHVKEYYLPQVMFEMLLTKSEDGLFGCYTRDNGTKIWLVEFNVEYMSLCLSIIKHLFTTFTAKGLEVPIAYFHNLPMDGKKNLLMRRQYERFIDLTNQICGTAILYADIPAADNIRYIDNILKQYRKVHPAPERLVGPNKDQDVAEVEMVSWPDMPQEIPPSMKICIYARAYFDTSKEPDPERRYKWVHPQTMFEERVRNLRLLGCEPVLAFMLPITSAMLSFTNYPAGTLERDVVKNDRIEFTETFAVFVLEALHKIYTSAVRTGSNCLQQALKTELLRECVSLATCMRQDAFIKTAIVDDMHDSNEMSVPDSISVMLSPCKPATPTTPSIESRTWGLAVSGVLHFFLRCCKHRFPLLDQVVLLKRMTLDVFSGFMVVVTDPASLSEAHTVVGSPTVVSFNRLFAFYITITYLLPRYQQNEKALSAQFALQTTTTTTTTVAK